MMRSITKSFDIHENRLYSVFTSGGTGEVPVEMSALVESVKQEPLQREKKQLLVESPTKKYVSPEKCVSGWEDVKSIYVFMFSLMGSTFLRVFQRIFMVKTLSLLSCTFVFSSLLATDLKNIEKVTIHSGVSDIKVLPLPANQVLSFKEVYKRPCAESHKIHFKVEQKDKELIFTAENSDGVKKVHPDLEVFVPSSLILDINVGSADVKVKSDLKELIVKSGDGDVDLYGAVNKLDVYSGNGDIEIHSNAAQKEGKFNLTTGNGDIEVKLLKGVKVQRDIKTGNGDIEEKILPEDPKAPVLDLVIKSGNGDVKLKQVEKE